MSGLRWVGIGLVAAVAGGCGGRGVATGGAEVVARGVPPISFLVSEPGTVWVRDVGTGALVHSGTFREVDMPFLVRVEGDVCVRDPDSGEEVELVSEVREENWHEIWFRPVKVEEREGEEENE